MIGAILLKRGMRRGYQAIGRHDLDAVMAGWAEDGVLEYPGHSTVSGRIVGRENIRRWFARWFDTMPDIRFTVKHVAVENLFALGLTNTVIVEWDLDETRHDGASFHATGASAFHVRHGKVTSFRDYIFDQEIIDEVWGGEAAT